MTESWARKFDDLSPEAVQVLKAMTLLDIAESTTANLSTVLDSTVEAAVEELRQANWLTTTSGFVVLPEDARIWLTYDATDLIGPDDAPIAARYVARQRSALADQPTAVQYVEANKANIVTAVRAGARASLFGEAADLAAATWQVAAAVDDSSWWHELAEHGEKAAIAARQPVTLIELLRRSAGVFAGAGDLYKAEKQQVRALSLAYKLGDRDRVVAGLTSLIELYHESGQPEGAADALLELASSHRVAGSSVARAEALAELGSVMLAAGRASRADSYLGRADEILTDDESAPNLLRARVAEQWGRALWRVGGTIRARRCFERALTLADDPNLRKHLERLLAVHVDDDLPPGDPVRFVGTERQ